MSISEAATVRDHRADSAPMNERPSEARGEPPLPERRSETIAVLAPTGRDAALATRVLARWGIEAETFEDHTALIASIRRGVGAVILAEEALVAPARNAIIAELDLQPSWSDLPLIILTGEGELSRVIANSVESLAIRSNVTLIERPVRIATLVTSVRSALRARARQYDVRDHLVLLNEARAEAEAANRAKSDFLAMMSHELRTPLNAIGGYADLMLLGIRGNITEEQREDLTRIQRSQRHLLGLINGVLNFARIERGAVEYDIKDVSLAELLAAAEPLVAPQAQARGLTIDMEIGTSLRVRADRDKLQQVVLNLLGNAIKFTEPGGRVRVSCERRGGGRVAILVQDTGHGIAADKLETIFEPFVQVDSRFTQTRDGVGLGLAISRDLARGMNGDLTVQSEVNVGSTFTFTLMSA